MELKVIGNSCRIFNTLIKNEDKGKMYDHFYFPNIHYARKVLNRQKIRFQDFDKFFEVY